MATTRAGYPYPVGTDRVMDGDNVIQSLATKIDGVLGYGLAGGSAVGPAPTAVNLQTSVAVTYPGGRYTAAPNVVAMYGGGIPSYATTPIISGGNNVTGVQFFYSIPTGQPLGTRTIAWIAFQA